MDVITREDKMSYLIKDTTEEERRRIVEESLGNLSGACDGCSQRVADMYDAYIRGEMELKDHALRERRDGEGASLILPDVETRGSLHTVISLIQKPVFTSFHPIATLIISIADTSANICTIGTCV